MSRRLIELSHLALMTALLASCKSPPPMQTPMCDLSSRAVGAAATALIDHDNRRDLEGVLAGYTDDVIWLTPQGDVIQGKDALRPRYESMFQNEVALAIEILEARGAGEIGYARGVTGGTLTPPNGEPAQRVNGKFLAITRCESGRWRVSHLMWSDAAAH
jgi:uncharacterized protein (TIGR02246 family)